MKLSKLYIFHILATFSILIWSGGCGCSSDQLNNIQLSLNAYDTDEPITKVIKTKVANQQFSLALLFDPSTLDNSVTVSGTASYYVFDNITGNMLVEGTDITYDTGNTILFNNIINTSPVQIISRNFTILSAYRNLRVASYTYIESITGSYIVNTISCNPMLDCGDKCPDDDSSAQECYRTTDSTDFFAVRPQKFSMVKKDGGTLNSLVSASNLDLNHTAEDAFGVTTNNYVTTYAIDMNISNYYEPNNTINTIDSTEHMLGTSILVTNPTFSNGLASNARVVFDNVGKITLHFKDDTWAAVDIEANDGTPQNCDPDGAYICGDVNATFIPANFTFDTITVKNANNKTYTYFSNDIDNNMSASIDINISARNALGNITSNYTSGLWEQDMNITIALTTANTPTLIINDIDDSQTLGFLAGSKIISWDEANTSKQLKFNFARSQSNPMNPILINANELSLHATTSYPTGPVTGTANSDNNITFTYARTHAPRQRFTSANESDVIYVETYCNGTDINGVVCDKTLLPNGTSSQYTDDPRWFINPSHTAISGNAGTITQKNGTKVTVGTVTYTTGKISVELNYTDLKYPYKASFQNTASSWLLYDKDATVASPATSNKFEVEFINSSTSWAGVGENSASTSSTGASKTNRRTMW